MRKCDKMGVRYYEYMNPWNAEKRKHIERQNIIKMCIISRKNELKLATTYTTSYVINGLIRLPKKTMWEWIRSSKYFDLYLDNGVCLYTNNINTIV